eukprot:14188-Heterococcus_DN1.PRE.1
MKLRVVQNRIFLLEMPAAANSEQAATSHPHVVTIRRLFSLERQKTGRPIGTAHCVPEFLMGRRTRQTCPACIAAAAEAAVAEHAHTASRQQQSQRPAPRRRRTALLALSACLLRADALLTGSVHAVSSSSSSSSRLAQRSVTEQQRQRIATVLHAASSTVSSSSSSSGSSSSSSSSDNIVLPGLRHNRPPRTDEGTFRSPKQKLGTLVQEMMALEGRKADMIASAADAAAAAAAAADEALADIIGGADDDAEDVRALLAVQDITFAERAAEAGMGEAEFVAVLRRGYW